MGQLPEQAGRGGAEPPRSSEAKVHSCHSSGRWKLEHCRLCPIDFRLEERQYPRRDVEEERAHHALRSEAQPRLDAPGQDAAAVLGAQRDAESLEGRGVTGREGGVDGVQERGRRRRRRVDALFKDELRQGGPDVAPAAGEHAGAHRGAGGAEADEDGVQQLVGEAADAVLAGVHERRR